MNKTVSVIIPTLNAELEIGPLLEELFSQTRVPDEIMVVDSSSDDATLQVVQRYPSIDYYVIDRKDFDHGLTRDQALGRSIGDIVCFMTQDALPANSRFVENLIRPILVDPQVAISSGRQLPKQDARRFEQLVRLYNYTDISNTRTLEDIPYFGIKTFFATDVCAAYRRDAYFACGGFEQTDMSEDMLMAAKAINSGWKVAYAADAAVYHSHNLTLKQQFERNRAIGRFLQRYSETLGCVSEVGEGSRLAKNVLLTLLQEREFFEALSFGADCVARFIGNRIGRNEARTKSS